MSEPDTPRGVSLRVLVEQVGPRGVRVACDVGGPGAGPGDLARLLAVALRGVCPDARTVACVLAQAVAAYAAEFGNGLGREAPDLVAGARAHLQAVWPGPVPGDGGPPR